MGTSFRATQMSVHAETARDRRDGQTDGQTDGFSALYSRSYLYANEQCLVVVVLRVRLKEAITIDQLERNTTLQLLTLDTRE